MNEWLVAAYPWIKSVHIIGIVAWMAGLLYLPRLYVYHAASRPGSDQSETFKVMERRLLRGIMLPAALIACGCGLLLAATPGVVDWQRGWIWAKLVLVGGLIGFHLLLAQWRRAFAADHNRHTRRFFRMVNEVPTLLLIAIVILAVAKPF